MALHCWLPKKWVKIWKESAKNVFSLVTVNSTEECYVNLYSKSSTQKLKMGGKDSQFLQLSLNPADTWILDTLYDLLTPNYFFNPSYPKS